MERCHVQGSLVPDGPGLYICAPVQQQGSNRNQRQSVLPKIVPGYQMQGSLAPIVLGLNIRTPVQQQSR